MSDHVVVTEDITYDEQVERWANGESVHRAAGVCCPDFSCCKPELAAEPEVRRAFAASNEDERMAFIGAFLQAAISLAVNERPDGKDLRIAVVGATEMVSA